MKLVLSGICGLLLAGCFYGEKTHDEKRLAKDFWLTSQADKKQPRIVLSANENCEAGRFVIDNDVTDVGCNDNFIIARQTIASTPDSSNKSGVIIYYHIVDIRNYNSKRQDAYIVYTLNNEIDFKNKRLKLGVQEELTFTIITHIAKRFDKFLQPNPDKND